MYDSQMTTTSYSWVGDVRRKVLTVGADVADDASLREEVAGHCVADETGVVILELHALQQEALAAALASPRTHTLYLRLVPGYYLASVNEALGVALAAGLRQRLTLYTERIHSENPVPLLHLTVAGLPEPERMLNAYAAVYGAELFNTLLREMTFVEAWTGARHGYEFLTRGNTAYLTHRARQWLVRDSVFQPLVLDEYVNRVVVSLTDREASALGVHSIRAFLLAYLPHAGSVVVHLEPLVAVDLFLEAAAPPAVRVAKGAQLTIHAPGRVLQVRNALKQ